MLGTIPGRGHQLAPTVGGADRAGDLRPPRRNLVGTFSQWCRCRHPGSRGVLRESEDLANLKLVRVLEMIGLRESLGIVVPKFFSNGGQAVPGCTW